ncbi:hypothetical protein [Chloroflexus sp.]|uniref:hypothetical protein n=1 Tax=Chloroflexus sp. TaxID=1904827 RepID=UPI002ACE5838|nr:hypothetical protein [Chloroflexus sp.]
MAIDRHHNRRWWLAVAALTALALLLRLLVWRWRELYPLGGDEAEYLAQALTLLQERRYVELRLMRPPLYPLFLAAAILVVDSLVQNLRLVQVVISALTVPLMALLGQALAQRSAPHMPPVFARWAGLLAGLLTALNYTLAANATELLTETLFLAGLSLVLWLTLLPSPPWWRALMVGVGLGALGLVRAVALPLLPLIMGWWQISALAAGQWRRGVTQAALVLLGCALVVGPWTVRNTLMYGGVILIDTTGAENLWLDNDPAGREAVKAQLYALGEDRLLRQRLATERGIAVITADPGRFITKMSRELRLFFALEHTDDMRERRAIWVSPAEVVARLGLGDGVWLLILLAGSYGLARRWQAAPARVEGFWRALLRMFADPRWLLGAWVAYVVLTTLIFHVELRYRLPLYPVLLAYSGMVGAAWLPALRNALPRPHPAALFLPLLVLAITLWHAPYPALAWQLAGKHLALVQAERALTAGDPAAAAAAVQPALARDRASVLARVALARAALVTGDAPAAIGWLDEAIALLSAHPYPHLLRGDLLRQQGDLAAARAELAAFEAVSREDLAAWLWDRAITPPPATLRLGDGLDLGFIRGMHLPLPGETGWRWTTGWAQARVTALAGAQALTLELRSGRPDGSAVRVWVTVDGGEPQPFMIGPDWQTIALPLSPVMQPREVVVAVRSPTFWPRQYDPASPDGRRLGVQVRQIVVR